MCLHSSIDPLDLGFNESLVDNCDYLDYSDSELNKRSDNTDLTVMQLNVRGILNKQCALKRLIMDVNRTHQLDLLLLAETWLKKTTENRVKISGYELVCSHRKRKKGGGGNTSIHQIAIQGKTRVIT